MHTLKSRVERMEHQDRLRNRERHLVFSWGPLVPSKLQKAKYEGVTYAQAREESGESFRGRLRSAMEAGASKFVFIDQIGPSTHVGKA